MSHHNREVWFRRTWLWASTAVHWKGAAVILTGLLAAGISFWIGDMASQPWIGVAGFIVSLAWMFIMAERHMDRPL